MVNLVFVHGWSVTNTSTYGELPEVLAKDAAKHDVALSISHIHLGRYISFHDEVTVEDIARAFEQALVDTLPRNVDGSIANFSCITHSTGGPVVREWVDLFYGKNRLDALPLKHLIMLAPANHGSALAALGKERVGRIKAWFGGVEPGQRILDWLSLGSDAQWRLSQTQLSYNSAENGFFPFVITGQSIDDKFYDFINDYLTEKGSDGVVRIAACNMNYRYVTLEQSDTVMKHSPKPYVLNVVGDVTASEETALAVVPDTSHSGKAMGIMSSVKLDVAQQKPVVDIILACLGTQTATDYTARKQAMLQITAGTQAAAAPKKSRYAMLVFQVSDDRGAVLKDYDLLILANTGYKPDKLPKGFFVDRQMNKKSGRLVYYVDADKMIAGLKAIGFRVTARPEKGFSHYAPAEFRSEDIAVSELIRPNETLYVNVVLKRRVAQNVLRLGPVSEKPFNFKKERPSPTILDD